LLDEFFVATVGTPGLPVKRVFQTVGVASDRFDEIGFGSPDVNGCTEVELILREGDGLCRYPPAAVGTIGTIESVGGIVVLEAIRRRIGAGLSVKRAVHIHDAGTGDQVGNGGPSKGSMHGS
jgi:hypothetical protein